MKKPCGFKWERGRTLWLSLPGSTCIMIVILAACFPLAVANLSAQIPIAPQHTSDIIPPIDVSLSAPYAPAPGQSAELIITVASEMAISQLHVQLRLPGFLAPYPGTPLELIDSISKDERKQHTFRVINTAGSFSNLPQKAWWTISARAGVQISDRIYVGDIAYLYMVSTGTSISLTYDPPGQYDPGYVSDAAPAAVSALPTPQRLQVLPEPLPFERPITSLSQPQAAATVTGGLLCWITDNNWGSGPASLSWGTTTGDTYSALNDRDQQVACAGSAQLVDAVTGAILDWDSVLGTFSLTTDACDPSNGVRVRFLPYTEEGRVVRYDASDYLSQTVVYGCGTTDSGFWFPIGLNDPLAPNFIAAYRIYNAMVQDAWSRGGWEWLVSEAGFDFNLYALVGTAQEVEYPVPSGHGTHAHFGATGRISIEGRDTTASWDVIQHEWFHRVTMYIWDPSSMNWFPTGCCIPHWIQNAYNPGLGLSEGIAEWNSFQAARWAGRPAGEYNFFSHANSYNVDLETPTWGSSEWANGESVEGRVAGAVIDILDNANDGYDTMSDTTANVWDMITKGTTGAASRDNGFIEMYNDGWRSRGHNDQFAGGGQGALYQNTIDVRPVTVTATVTSTVGSTSYTTRYTTTTVTSYTSTSTSTSTIPTLTTVVLFPLTVTSTVQSTQYLTSILTTTVTSYTGTETSTSTVVVPTTVTIAPSTSTSTVQTTQVLTSTGTTTVTGYTTTTVTSYTSTSTSTSTIPTLTTVALVPLTVTSTVQSTQFLTSILTTTVTSYTGTETSTSTIPTVTTVVLVPSTVTSTVQSTQYLTSTVTTTVTSYTATQTSTSTSVVYTTVTTSGAGASAPSSLTYFGFLSLLAVTVGRRVTTGKGWRIPRIRSLTERRCSAS